MYKKEINFFDRPKRNQLIISFIIWILGMAYLLNWVTASFTKNPFQKKFNIPVVLIFAITIFISKQYYNYKVKGRK